MNRKLLLSLFLAFFFSFLLSNNTFAEPAIGKCSGTSQSNPKNSAIKGKCDNGSGGPWGVVWINNIDNNTNAEITTESSSLSVTWDGQSGTNMPLYVRGAYLDYSGTTASGMDAHFIRFTNGEHRYQTYQQVLNAKDDVSFIAQPNKNTVLGRGTSVSGTTHWSTGWENKKLTVQLNVKKFIDASSSAGSCGTNCTKYTHDLYIFRCPTYITDVNDGGSSGACGTGAGGKFTLTLSVKVNPKSETETRYQYVLKTGLNNGTNSGSDSATSTEYKTESFSGALTSSLTGATESGNTKTLTNTSRTTATISSYGFSASITGDRHGISGYPKYKITKSTPAGQTTLSETGTLPDSGGTGNIYSFTKNNFSSGPGTDYGACLTLEYADSVKYSYTLTYSRPWTQAKKKDQIKFRSRTRTRTRTYNFSRKKWNDWSGWSSWNNSTNDPSSGWSDNFNTYQDAINHAHANHTHTVNITTSSSLNTWLDFRTYTESKTYTNSEATDKASGTKSNWKRNSGGDTKNKSITKCLRIRHPYVYWTTTYNLKGTSTAQSTDVTNAATSTKTAPATGTSTSHAYVKDNNYQMKFDGKIEYNSEASTAAANDYQTPKSSSSAKAAVNVAYTVDRSDSTGLDDINNGSWTLFANNNNTRTTTPKTINAVTTTNSGTKKRTALNVGHSQSYDQKVCFDSKIVVENGSDGRRQVISREQSCATADLNFHFPYNFDTSSSAKIGSIIYSGSTATAEFASTITGRKNPLVQSSAYQTATPTITKQGAIFLVPGTANVSVLNNIISGSTNLARSSASTLCNAIKSKLGASAYSSYVKNCTETTDTSKTFTVPDNQLGAKICVVAGLNYADSHNYPGGNLTTGSWDSNRNNASFGANKYSVSTGSGAPDYSPNWRLSPISCAAIAEKPIFETWNAGFQTDGFVETSVFPRIPNANIKFDATQSGARIFGSWSDTSFITGKNSTGFASASALGYPNGNNTNHTCDLSKLSLANLGPDAACQGANANSANQKIIPSGISNSTSNKITQLELRYATNITDTTTGRYTSGNIRTTGDNIFHNFRAGDNSIDYQQYDSYNPTLNDTLVVAPGANTRVIKVNGTLNINKNICVGSGGCSNSSSTLALSSRNNQSFTDSTFLPQVIIIADNINIGPDVDQIDAWLVARGSGSGGTINTCNAAKASCKKTLLINGPILSGKLELNRINRGAGASVDLTNTANLNSLGVATPAEIFNLRPDITLWAYQQSTAYIMANTVYAAKLAPRL